MQLNDHSSTLLCHCSWTFILSRSWTAKKSTPPTISLVEWIFFAVHERAFYGPLWTKSLAKSLFLVVHERLYGIVHQHAFIPRCWTHPNSLADYLHFLSHLKRQRLFIPLSSMLSMFRCLRNVQQSYTHLSNFRYDLILMVNKIKNFG